MFAEFLGIAASLMIICAFLFKDIRIIRILDGIGAALFILYGFLIHSFSNILLNTFLVIIQVVQLARLYRKSKEQRNTKDDVEGSSMNGHSR